MIKSILRTRYSVLLSFVTIFLLASFLVRTILLLISFSKLDLSLLEIFRIYFLGFAYDFGVALYLTAFYNVYLLLLPGRWAGSMFNKVITFTWLFLILLISYFSFFAEITFWEEFESRFNFIAVDYLIYTYEVVNNINESYPLPLLISGVLLMVLLTIWLFARKKVFISAFHPGVPFKKRLIITAVLLVVTFSYPVILSNVYADSGKNRYDNELSKAGIYAFFSAFRNNELNYNDFYALLPEKTAFNLIHLELAEQHSRFTGKENTIERVISNHGPVYKPNVIMITVESLSADFMAHFGNKENLTPVVDSLADQYLLFTNMYATGTRTVRGMEALTLSVPPTPGSSIVRRPGNENLATVGHIFEQAGYSRTFYYGGDGYFDNMNEFFGSNGFDITDRGRNLKINDTYVTRRTMIPAKQVHFENAWGISDEDLFDAVLRTGDKAYKSGKPFYNFVMTTSNHRPYTFPEGKINRAQGSREAAVRYTDYAIGEFLKKMKKKTWFKNTVVIIVADHCAGSAGKNEIEISKYHIPCVILNLPQKGRQVIDKMCSQIDLYPTLFSLLGWKYESKFFGQDVTDPTFQPRALLGTYQKLAYLRKDSLVILGPQQKVETFIYHQSSDELQAAKLSPGLIKQAMANYQTAYNLFKNGGMHQ